MPSGAVRTAASGNKVTSLIPNQEARRLQLRRCFASGACCFSIWHRVPRVGFGTEVSVHDALESDLAMPATEITSRHRIDKRLLLPFAARRDAVARNATSHIAPRYPRPFLQRSLRRVLTASAINEVRAVSRERSSYMVHENGKKRAGTQMAFTRPGIRTKIEK
jgi:hypothetical protein